MAVTKQIRVRLLPETWPRGATIPRALRAAAADPYPADVLSCVLFTALLTRPPVNYGFSLADCWAWLRYIPALSPHPFLRLRPEWTHLDPHQKTVLSGELGVGFTTWFLHRTLGFEQYADTLWVVNTKHPGLFGLGRSTKRGPNKSPDYIAVDGAGDFSVIECKGTQTSLASLLAAMERGRPQKRNLRQLGATRIKHSLVAGLYIPQDDGADEPTLAIADPDWAIVKRRLSGFSRDELRRGVTQIAAAKEMAFMELPETARALARDKGAAESVTAAFQRDLDLPARGRSASGDEIRVIQEHRWPMPALIAHDFTVTGLRFEARLAGDDVVKLQTVESPDQLAEQKVDQGPQLGWTTNSQDGFAELKSPLGTTYRLTLLEA